jgi:hypothetical protein
MMPALSNDDLDLLTELAMHHARLVQRLRDALEAEDTMRALELAREVCGMTEEETE